MNVSKQALDVIAAELEQLLAEADNELIRVKLQNLNEVCHHLVVKGRQRLTVPDVVSAYAARFHSPNQSLAESSIRNKRNGANPYQKLYRAWENASKSIRVASARSNKPSASGEIISQEDADGIVDSVLRHQVSLLLAQNRSYKSQLDMLREVRGAPLVKLVSAAADAGPVSHPTLPALTEAEAEAIRDFAAINKLRARGLRNTENGSLETIDGRRLADPGFMDALKKIAEEYDR